MKAKQKGRKDFRGLETSSAQEIPSKELDWK